MASAEDVEELVEGKLLVNKDKLATEVFEDTNLITIRLDSIIPTGTKLDLYFSDNVYRLSMMDSQWSQTRVYDNINKKISITYTTAPTAVIRLFCTNSSSNEFLKVFEKIAESIDVITKKQQALIADTGGTLYKEDGVAAGFLSYSEDGNLHLDVNWSTTDYLDLKGTKEIEFLLYNLNHLVCIVFYDSNKDIVQIYNEYNSLVKTVFSVPNNAVYMRVSLSKLYDSPKQYVKYGVVAAQSIDHSNTVQNTANIADNTLSILKIDGKDYIYKKDSFVNNGFLYVAEEGALHYDQHWNTTDYIECIANTIEVKLYNTNSHAVCVVYYDESKNIISYDNNYNNLETTILNVPQNAKYFRASIQLGSDVIDKQYVKQSIKGILDELLDKSKVKCKKRIHYDLYNNLDKGLVNAFTNSTLTAKGLELVFNARTESVITRYETVSLEAIGTARLQVLENSRIEIAFTAEGTIGLRYDTSQKWAQIEYNWSSLVSLNNVGDTSQGDILKLTLFRYYDEIVAIIQNETRGWENSFSYTYNSFTYPREGNMPIVRQKFAVNLESGSVLLKSMDFNNQRWKRIPTTVVIGDSISSMFFAGDREHCWQFVAFGNNVDRMCTLGYPGAKSDLMLNYLDDALGLNPKYLAIYLGTNDVLNNVSLDTFKSNITQMVEGAINVNIIPIIIGLAPIHGTIPTTYNEVLQNIAKDYELKYIDTSSVVTTGMIVGDGVHLSPEGHAALGTLFSNTVPDAIN